MKEYFMIRRFTKFDLKVGDKINLGKGDLIVKKIEEVKFNPNGSIQIFGIAENKSGQ